MRACAPGAGQVAANAEKLPWTETDGRAQEEVGGSGSKNKALAATAAQTATRSAAKRVPRQRAPSRSPWVGEEAIQLRFGFTNTEYSPEFEQRSPERYMQRRHVSMSVTRVSMSDESCLLDHVGTLSSVRKLTPLPPGGPSVMRRIRRPSTERRHPAVAPSRQSGQQKYSICTAEVYRCFCLTRWNFLLETLHV